LAKQVELLGSPAFVDAIDDTESHRCRRGLSRMDDLPTTAHPRGAQRPPSATNPPPRDPVNLPFADPHWLQVGAATAAATGTPAVFSPPAHRQYH